MKKNRNDGWILVDEETNAIDYLEKSFYFISMAKVDSFAYKWAAISLFGALYGFAICAIRGTDSRYLIDPIRKGNYLINFNKALSRCQLDNFMRMTINSRTLKMTDKEHESVRILKNEIRNQFEHFYPQSMAIKTEIFDQIIPDIYRIINFLALQTGNYVLTDRERYDYVESLFLKNKVLAFGPDQTA